MAYKQLVFSLFLFHESSAPFLSQVLIRISLLLCCLHVYVRFIYIVIKCEILNMTDDQRPFVPKTPMDFQKLKLERLMANPNKPVIIPETPKEKKGSSVPEFVRNVMGSSAGAGSGEFHVYRHLRRKEYTRQKIIEEKGEKEKLDDEFRKRLEDNKRKMEEKTAKRRAKRLKKKQKQKRAKGNKKQSSIEIKNSSSEDESTEKSDECDANSDKELGNNSESSIKHDADEICITNERNLNENSCENA